MRTIGIAALLVSLAACTGGKDEGHATAATLVCDSGCDGGELSVSLGSLSVGHRLEKQLRLRNAGAALTTDRMYLEAGPGLSASLQCETGCRDGRLAHGAVLIARLTWAPTAPGPISPAPLLHLGGKSIALAVKGEAQAVGLHCDAEAIDFGPVPEGASEKHPLGCENHGGAPLDLTLGSLPAGFTTDHPERHLEPGERAVFDISFSGVRSSAGLASVVLPDGSTAHSVRLSGIPGEPLEIRSAQQNGSCHSFGWVAPGTSSELRIELRNGGNAPLDLQHLGLVGDPAFTVGAFGPLRMEPGEVREVRVRFAPTAVGSTGTTLAIRVDERTIPVCIEGAGGGPLLRCDATPIDFGATRVGSPRVRTIRCGNEGWDDPDTEADGLFLETVEVSGDAFRAELPASTGPWPAGSTFTVDVVHDPVRDSIETGTVTIRSRGGATAVVELAGDGRALPACTYEIVRSVEFGEVGGRQVELGLVLTNVGASDCLVADVQIEGDDAFSLGGEVRSLLNPGDRTSIAVLFTPKAGQGDAEGTLAFSISADEPAVRIPLHGRSTTPCLRRRTADPYIGDTAPNCSAARRDFVLVNECDEAVTLTDASFFYGDSFTILSGPSFPLVIEPGFTTSFDIAFLAMSGGSWKTDALLVSVEGWDLPLLLQVAGSMQPGHMEQEHFEATPPVDVLFVMENSSSAEWHHFWERPLDFFSHGETNDFHVGVTTTGVGSWGAGPTGPAAGGACGGGAAGSENGRLYPADGYSPRIIQGAMSPAVRDAAWGENWNVGPCGGGGEGLEAARLALSPPLINHADVAATLLPYDGNLGFLRDEAELHVVFLSDSDDNSPLSAETYVSFLRGMKDDPRMVKAHAVVGEPSGACANSFPGHRYAAVADALGGSFVSWCNDGATVLDRLGAAILAPKRCYQLEHRPSPGPSTIEENLVVQVNGRIVQPIGTQGQPIWSWDDASNSVCFATPRAAGDRIDVTYRLPCL